MVAEETGQSQSSAQCEREIERERKNSPNLIQTKVAFDILCELNSISRFSRVCEDVAAWSVERRREQDDAAEEKVLPVVGIERLTSHAQVLSNYLLFVLCRLHLDDRASCRGVGCEQDVVFTSDTERDCGTN